MSFVTLGRAPVVLKVELQMVLGAVSGQFYLLPFLKRELGRAKLVLVVLIVTSLIVQAVD